MDRRMAVAKSQGTRLQVVVNNDPNPSPNSPASAVRPWLRRSERERMERCFFDLGHSVRHIGRNSKPYNEADVEYALRARDSRLRAEIEILRYTLRCRTAAELMRAC